MAKRFKTFSKKEAIAFGWRTATNNLFFFAGVTLVVYGVQFIPDMLSGYVDDRSLLSNVISGVVYVISLGLTLGSLKIYLAFVDGEKAPFSDLFSLFGAGILWRYFLSELLYGLAVVFGLILFIVPGIYFAIRYGFYLNVLIDKRLGVFESFSKSAQITKGHMWNLFLFQLLLALIVLVGFLALGIGLFVALPVIFLADMYVYRKLSSLAKAE